jgi:5'-nucleotidase
MSLGPSVRRTPRMPRLLALAAATGLVLSTTLAVAAGASAAQPPGVPKGTVDVQLLSINDFHGNLEPPAGSSGRVGSINAGGIEYLATHVKALEAANPNTLVVSAGDLIGASPLLSALFHDEPTIEGMNALGLDYNAVGNHEFDEGAAELLRMQNGGCHPVDGCQDGDPFHGADFQFLAANVVRADNGKTLFPAYKIRSFAGAKIALVGVVTRTTPTIVTPSGVAGLEFLDEADTVNALVPELRAKGINTIIVLIHEGGLPASSNPINGCVGVSGAIQDIVTRMDPAVDVVLSGHTHQAYNCVVDKGNGHQMLLTSGFSFGRLVTDVDLTIDRSTGEPVTMSANNVIVTRDVAKDPSETALIAKYQSIAAPLANRVIGSITADITRSTAANGESALGDVIADAQLLATQPAGFGDAVVAFMNPGGIRADLTYAQISGGELPGQVTYGESFTVQPFGNSLVTMTLTGADIDLALEQQFDNPTPGASRILQVSNGLTYDWSTSAPVGSKVAISSIRINGVAISAAASYRVTVNSFLADGGDNFLAFKNGTDRLGGAVDTDALEAYFVANSPVAPGPRDRITVIP